jgi:ribonuclease HIII
LLTSLAMDKKTTFTFPLTPPQQKTLITILRSGNYRPVTVEHTIIAAETDTYRVCLYKSGKAVIQGKEAEEFVTYTIEPIVLQKAVHGYEEVLTPEILDERMGVDESGKGDFFGPMVIAAVWVNADLCRRMKEMNVRDSKTITSDKKAMEMGRDLRELCRDRFALVKIGPEAYNRLYTKFRSVNSMLAWGHARAIENLLERVPNCPKAISDQFGKKELIEKALMKRGKTIKLVQRHKAESDMAVAAASIIAREQFLRAMLAMGQAAGKTLPKGASEAVKQTAIELVKAKGPQFLVLNAKCHFKTADEVLQSAGMARKDLGPTGQAKSRPVSPSHNWHRKPDQPASEE